MNPKWLTDEQVEQEIARLSKSPMVALARKEQRIRYQRRQTLYNLRNLEKRGQALAEAGWSPELLEELGEEEAYE